MNLRSTAVTNSLRFEDKRKLLATVAGRGGMKITNESDELTVTEFELKRGLAEALENTRLLFSSTSGIDKRYDLM